MWDEILGTMERWFGVERDRPVQGREARPSAGPNLDYGPVFQRIEARLPALVEEGNRHRQEAEGLLEELLQLTPERRLQRVEEESFAQPAVVGVLLETSEAQLAERPAEAENLAWLAARLAFRIEPALRKMSAEAVQAFCLMGSAWRLVGDFERAERSLGRSIVLALDCFDDGLYCRSLGLLRWEQGRHGEGLAFLKRSIKFFEDDARQEHGVSLALTGLLLIERRDYRAAYDPLVGGLAALDPEVSPGLRVRAGMALALCHAHRGEKGRARALRTEVRQTMSELREAEQLPVLWLEGRLAGCLGDRGDALDLLEAVRTGYLRRGRPVETVLAAIDEAPLLADAERSSDEFLAEIEQACGGQEGLGESLAALRQLVRGGREQTEPLRCDDLARKERARLRRKGLRAEPLPYA